MSRVGSRDAWTKKRKLTSSADPGNVKKVKDPSFGFRCVWDIGEVDSDDG